VRLLCDPLVYPHRLGVVTSTLERVFREHPLIFVNIGYEAKSRSIENPK
jgi:hypothetical protein